MANFILTRKSAFKYTKNNPTPRIRISVDAYDMLTAWASETDRTISEIASKAVEFAAQHLVILDQD